MGERGKPAIYTIAAHRGFADALVAGIAPRYSDGELGLARLTLIVPSSRAARTLSESFVRYSGERGLAGMLMPRMVTVGDLNLDESLGALLDPLGASEIPPAVEPTRRWLELAQLIETERAEQNDPPLPGAALLRYARETARTIDRLLVEEKEPDDLLSEAVLGTLGDLSRHWQRCLRTFSRVQARWCARLEERGEVNAATRRNLLFDRAAKEWRDNSPEAPIIAAGVTSASPALARMLRVIAGVPQGSVVLPDLDLSLSDEAWEELGHAGATPEFGGDPFTSKDAATHPQYHLKLLLERMGIARGEVREWQDGGELASPPVRQKAITSLFLPPKASRSWAKLEEDTRKLAGIRLMTSPNSDEEALAIATLVREALEQPEKRVAVISADRSLARRVSQHLERWNIQADDSAGRALSLTPAGRLFGLLTELASMGAEPAQLVGMLAHPLVRSVDGEARRKWLLALRSFDRELRGPSPAPGLPSLREIARKAGVEDWWSEVEDILVPILTMPAPIKLAEALDTLTKAAELLAVDAVWSREDGRALSNLVEDIRQNARETGTMIVPTDLSGIMRDAMEEVAVRPPYGGHPRVSIYGLLESRMARADLVICAGLNEGSWPQTPGADTLLAPGILRALGMPPVDLSIGLAAHDLVGAMGAPEVVLSRSQRDADGPTLPSRFLLRVEALLGDLVEEHRETRIPTLVAQLGREAAPVSQYPRPMPRPSVDQRKVDINVTALDRLLGDPYQFYAQEILKLRKLEPLAADPFNDPALRGTLVHEILDAWHKACVADPDLAIVPFATKRFEKAQVHPLFKGLWQPRILAALERFEQWTNDADGSGRVVLTTETNGAMDVGGVRVRGRADRIDRLDDGSLAIVDYKTGGPPTAAQVEAGYALQMGLLGLIARDGCFEADEVLVSGKASLFEYWSLAKKNGEFGYIDEPVKSGRKRAGLLPEEFLPKHEEFLQKAISTYLKGDAPFTAKENPDYPGYSDYDQLMRLEEWVIRLSGADEESSS